MLDGVAFFAGLAFFEPTTVMPVLLKKLGAADWQVGLARLIQVLGFALPSLFASHFIQGRARHKDFLIISCALGRIPVLTIPLALFWFAETRPDFALAWFLTVFALFWLMDGGSVVSWFDIIGKTIPERVRGRFFGALQSLTGIAAMASGAVVALILGSRSFPYPSDFALLAGLWFIGGAISLAALFYVREPAGVTPAEEKPRFVAYIRGALPLLRANPRVARLMVARLMLEGGAMASPFYVLFARQDLRAPLETVGLYTVALSVGKVASGPLWGWLSDHRGPVISFRAVAAATAAVPALALLSTALGAWLLVVAFSLLGAVQDGLWMTGSTVILESVDERDRLLVIGVSSLFQSPSALFGVIGGVIAQTSSYPLVFGCGLAVTLAGLLAALKIPRAPALSPA